MGDSDCEHIGHRLLAQPANALSSLVYLAVGTLLLRRALASRSSTRLVLIVYAATVLVVGLGSVAFHGPMPAWARFAHDLSIASVLAFAIGYDLGLARDASVRVSVALFGAVVGTSAVVLAVSADASNPMVAVLVVAAVAAEVAAGRSPTGRAAARGLVHEPAVWVIGAVALGMGAALNALGRTNAPLCDPDSPVQLHAVWHVLTAFVLWAYGTAVLGPREGHRRIIPA